MSTDERAGAALGSTPALVVRSRRGSLGIAIDARRSALVRKAATVVPQPSAALVSGEAGDPRAARS